MKNHTLIGLTKKVGDLNMQLTTLKKELAANTQALGCNTLAVEGITKGLKELAKETGGWRSDDKGHHEDEGNLDRQKIKKMDDLNETVKQLVEVLKK